MKITQIPITVKLREQTKNDPQYGGALVPFNLSDIPTDIPVQVIGWVESPGGIPCWLLLGMHGVHPVSMSLVEPVSWADYDVVGH